MSILIWMYRLIKVQYAIGSLCKRHMDPSHVLQSWRKIPCHWFRGLLHNSKPYLPQRLIKNATTTQVWNTDKKSVWNVFGSHTNTVRCLEFSHDGRFLLSAAVDNTIRLWNMRDGSVKVFTNPEFWREFKSATFSPDGKHVAAGNKNGVVRIWDVWTGQSVQRLKGHTGTVYGVMFTPDGKGLVSSGSKDSTLKYWNIAPFKHIWSLHTKEPQRTNNFADHLQLKPVQEFSGHTVCWFSFLLLSPPNKSFLLSHNRALSSPLLCRIMANGSSLVPEISVSVSGMLIMQ